MILSRPAISTFLLDFLPAALHGKVDVGTLTPRTEFREDVGLSSLDFLSLATRLSNCSWLHKSGAEDYLLTAKTVGDWIDVLMQSQEFTPRTMGFETSGTTGDPVLLRHEWEDLTEEAEFWAGILEGRRIRKAVPAHHIYGFLFTVLLPEISGLPVDDVRSKVPSSLRLEPGDIVVTHPFHLQLMLQGNLERWDGVRFVVSTAPCPEAHLEGVQSRGADFIQVYGSTETGGLGCRSSADVPYTPLPWWTIGDTWRRGEREFELPDHIRWEEGGFYPAGRKDRAVVIGGHNVGLEQVRKKLLQMEGVVDVTVKIVETRDGPRLKVRCIGDFQDDDSRRNMIAKSRSVLTDPEWPTEWEFEGDTPCRHV